MFILNGINGIAFRAAIARDADRLQRWAQKYGCEKEMEKVCEELEPFPQAAAIAKLLLAFHGDVDALKADVRKVCKILRRPEKTWSKAGRPREWTKGEMFYAWCPVEAEYRALKATHPKPTIREAINILFSGLPKSRNQKLCVLHDLTDASCSRYLTRDSAEKYHRAFREHMKTLPSSSQDRLNKQVERAKGYILREQNKLRRRGA